MLDPKAVATFLCVVHEGSFTKAASALDTSPSVVSRAIAKLESDLSVKLFHRTTRSLSLTVEGREFHQGARELVQDWEDLEARVAGRLTSPTGLVRLSLPSAVGRDFILDHLVDFRRLYPLVEMEVSFQDQLANLAEQGFDLVVRTGELADSANHMARKFFDFDVILCASEAYLAQAPPLSGLGDLEQHSCIRFRNTATGRIFPWWMEPRGFKVPRTLVFDDGPAIARACELGAGLAMLPTWLGVDRLKQGRLVEVLPEHKRPFSTPVWIVHLNRQILPARTRVLLDFLVSRREELQARLRYP